MGIDANARVDADESGVIGRFGDQKTNDNGMRFIAFLEALGLTACNMHWDAGYTWRSAKGPTSRLDYVCTVASRLGSVIDSWVPDTIDLSMGAREDHRVVCVSARAPSGVHADLSPSVFRVNKAALGDWKLCRRFEDLIWAYNGGSSMLKRR